MEVETLKRCAKCQEMKPIAEFSRKAQQRSGLNTRCKSCIKEDSAIYYSKHQDELRENCRRRYRDNPTPYKDRASLWAKSHPEQSREIRRDGAHRRRLANLELMRQLQRKAYWRNPERHRLQAKQYREHHPDIVRSYNKHWQLTHVEERRDINARRRARKRLATVELFSRKEIFERDKGHCHICGRKVNPQKWHLDHKIPLSRGGDHSRLNTAVSCPMCNQQRSNVGPAQLRIV